MRILLLGATGHLGSRLLPSLLHHSHTVIPFIRNPSALPAAVLPHLPEIEQGDARSASSIKSAFTRHNCDAMINTAGYAAMSPWGKSALPDIVDAVIQAAVEIGNERGAPVRVWLLGGIGGLDIPGTGWMGVDYMRMFPEHRHTISQLESLPKSSVNWSLLCPGMMHALGEVTYPTVAGDADHLVAAAGVPPDWGTRFLCVPLIGGYLNVFSQVGAYATALEDNADFIARDLVKGEESEWLWKRVGTKRR
ncbi:hypothetical protein BO78DRAFT_308245 [Aspergillus sclerotiicarbonarius CBS 121057]|uniref:NAD(P)-binding domain-containing protein n=1 Tax=Aspergillus sclerotiicarbonarius (strain CBS 121057 / IBT 28362) TaxID=1448318 RepID=A0A319EG75_ASPSB|nr:hypothetical protein BO78DRAFT_308245 [Aspergillus sclerotiicarbonarius CBS 121057]